MAPFKLGKTARAALANTKRFLAPTGAACSLSLSLSLLGAHNEHSNDEGKGCEKAGSVNTRICGTPATPQLATTKTILLGFVRTLQVLGVFVFGFVGLSRF